MEVFIATSIRIRRSVIGVLLEDVGIGGVCYNADASTRTGINVVMGEYEG